MSKQLPFMSVVVISYNGETVIGRAIESLLAQDYPKERYEIIVVDDASTDKTAEIAQAYPIRYHRQVKNGGVSNARTAGMRLARGDIYVCFDDDCYVEKDWLGLIAQGYQSGEPLGVGGTLVNDDGDGTLVQRYMKASNIEPAERGTRNIFAQVPVVGRVMEYILSNFKNTGESTVPTKSPAGELYGANSSYDMKVLRSVGGWDDYFNGIEDRAIGKAMTLQYPDRTFYVMRDARIYHQPDMTLRQYLLRPYKRGIYNLRFHLRYHIFPPVFPFPCLFLVLLLAALCVDARTALAVAIMAPPLLYCWWISFAVKTRSLTPLLFGYLQMAEESMVILGLLRGFMMMTRRKYAER